METKREIRVNTVKGEEGGLYRTVNNNDNAVDTNNCL
jgi:hypothetical protein